MNNTSYSLIFLPTLFLQNFTNVTIKSPIVINTIGRLFHRIYNPVILMNTKVIAILAVVVVVAAGAGAAVFLMNGNDSPYRSSDLSGRLAVFGNANNDDYLDGEDLKVVDDIIAGNKNKDDYPFADANQDGEITNADHEWIEKMINRESMDIYYLNGFKEVKKIGYPIKRAVVVGTNAAMTMQAIGAVTAGKIVGTTGEASKDTYLFSDLNALPKVSTSVLAADYDAVQEIGNVDTIVTMASKSYLKNEATFTGAEINVVRISSSDGLEAVSVALTMGYLFQLEDRANEYAKLCDDVLKYINEKKKNIDESKPVTTLTMTMTNYVSGTSSDYYELTTMVGAKNLADWSETTKRFNAGDEWLLNEKYYCDIMLHYHQYSYDPSVDQKDMYTEYRGYFADTQMVKDGHYRLMNSNMPAIVRLAYTASIMYPEIFGANYGDEIHQQYVDRFLDNLKAKNYKVTDHKFVFCDSDFGF